MTTLFSLNLNKIALLRNSRGTDYPNLEYFTKLAIESGVRSITVHPRPDERHIRFDDLAVLERVVRQNPGVELNIEGYPNDRFIEAVNAIKPDQVTLVPDGENQLTSDHGWSIEGNEALLRDAVSRLQPSGARVCLFWDPVPEGLDELVALGVKGVELYTEPYVRAFEQDEADILDDYVTSYEKAKALGLRVNGGHDLNLENLGPFLQRCPVDEVSIGHGFMVESILQGFGPVVEAYLKICSRQA